MKKRILSVLCAAMVLVLSACGGGTGNTGSSTAASGSTPAAPSSFGGGGEYNFSMACTYAAVNNHGLLAQAWCDEITARTDGRVTFDFYAGASLVADNASYDAVKNGIADIAMFSTASTPGVFPAMSLMEVPQGYASGWVGTKVANDFIADHDLAELADVHPLYIHTTSPLVILGNKPINSVNDIKGMIIRTGSDLATKTVTALGGQSYSCQITELYEALTKNMCDAAISGSDTLAGFNLAEAVKYVFPDPSYGKIGVILTAMNKSKWDALPDDIKTVFTEVSAEFADKQGMCWSYEDAVALSDFEENYDGEVVTFDDATKSALKELLEPVNEEFSANTGLSAEDIASYTEYFAGKIESYNAAMPSRDEAVTWGETELAAYK